jgi:micrococcal nuclease
MMISRLAQSPIPVVRPVVSARPMACINEVRFASETSQSWVTWKRARAGALATAIFTAGFIGRGYWDVWTTPSPHKVVSVHDGDTFKTYNGESIRLFGMDSPELNQPFGPEAQAYLEKLVQGRTVSLKRKGQSFNRSVYVVMVGSLDVNREMVRVGLAYEEPHYGKGEYKEAEAEARKAKRGVWQKKDGGERPWDYRDRMKHEKKGAALNLDAKAPFALAIFPENHPEKLRLIPFADMPNQVAADLRRRTGAALV